MSDLCLSEVQVRDLQDQLETNKAALLHLRGELERYKEKDSRQAALLQSLKDRERQGQGSSENVFSIKTQANCSIFSLQGQNQELRDRVSELEDRLRLHLREREQSEQRAVSAERRLSSTIKKLAQELSVDPGGKRDPLLYLTNKACEMFQERHLWESKAATLEETLANQELEFKASRQTLIKLASEAGKAQDVAASFSEDVKTARKERDEALCLKAAAEQECQVLQERLANSQRALGSACQAQAHNEKRASDLDHDLRTSAYHTRAAEALHQCFIQQLATLLSDGSTTLPATEDAVRNKVGEIGTRDRARTAKVARLEEEINKVNDQLESRSKLYHEAVERAHRAEVRLSDCEEAIGHLEGQLAAEDLIKGRRQFERQRVTSQRERLASNRQHIQLMSCRLSQLEAMSAEGKALPGRGEQDIALGRLQQKVERLQGELELTKKKKGGEIAALKAQNTEQSRTIRILRESQEKLEAVKDKVARKVVSLTSEREHAERRAWERNASAQSVHESLSHELHSTRRALEEMARRERQLVDFREFVTRALGFNTNSMAVPDDKVYLELKAITRGRGTLRTSSPPRSSADGVGARTKPWPSHSPPHSWGQSRSHPSSLHRGYSDTA
ncbi:coiled-coil domain-containing protein 170-like isoform X2 [Narcine bancroftii]